MAWQPNDLMTLKRDLVELALQEVCNRRELCRRFGTSPKTGYALFARHAQEGAAAYAQRSRRPHSSPTRTAPGLEQAVIDLRRSHPSCGGRKITRRLTELGVADVPPPSTVTSILHRHGLIVQAASVAAQHW